MALRLFRAVADRVPAYQKFLTEHHINPSSVKSIEDFRQVPLVDKDNYLRKYPLAELCWDGDITNAKMISASSGSTGEPHFWPHGRYAVEVGEWHKRLVFEQQLGAKDKKTLVLMCYTLGTWIAGTHILDVMTNIADSGWPMTVISPGIDKAAAIRSVKMLSPYFDQIVIQGYPPFVKDILDEGELQGIDWPSLNVKMTFGGEPFSEGWRDYVLEKVGSSNPLLDTVNLYGCADAGIMAIETPTSIAVHRGAAASSDFSEQIFGHGRVPTIQQYHPALRYFEIPDEELVVTTNNAMPLVRYNLKDTGGLIQYEDLIKAYPENELREDLAKDGDRAYLCTMPFVYVYGRSHNTATLYALNVYPENVRAATEDKRIRHLVSGKIKLVTENNKDMDQYLHVIMELAPSAKQNATMKRLVKEVVIENLKRYNMEYRKLLEAIGTRAHPVITFVPHGDPVFRPGAKMAKVETKRG